MLGSPGTSPLDLAIIDSRERLRCAAQIPREFERSSLEIRKTGAMFLLLSLKFTMFNQGNEHFTPRIYLRN